MSSKRDELKLIRMNEVEAIDVSWLWYPYIPYGKITVVIPKYYIALFNSHGGNPYFMEFYPFTALCAAVRCMAAVVYVNV